MVRFIAVLALSLTMPALALAAAAEESDVSIKEHHFKHHKKGGSHPMDNFKKALNLSPEQEKQARKAFAQGQKDHRKIVQKYVEKLPDSERQAMKAELDASFNARHEQFLATLSTEQQFIAKALFTKHSKDQVKKKLAE